MAERPRTDETPLGPAPGGARGPRRLLDAGAAIRVLRAGEAALRLALLGLTAAILLTGGVVLRVGGVRLALDQPENPFLLFLALQALAWWRAGARWTCRHPLRLVVLAVAAYVAGFGLLSTRQHLLFRTNAFDLGIFDQVVWHIAHGREPHSSILGRHFFGEHLSPVLYGVAALYRLAPSPVTLLVLQSAALGAGGLLVFGLARSRLGSEPLAAAAALLYLLYPPLHGVNLYDFHPIALTTPLLLGALLAFERERVAVGLGLLGLTLLCQEDAALPVAATGAYLWRARRRPGVGALVVLGGLAAFAVALALIIPVYRGTPYPFYERYASLGGSPAAVIRTALVHPVFTAQHLLTPEKLLYLVKLLGPLGFLPLLAPWELAPALPSLLLNLASDAPPQYSIRYQYAAPLVPFLFLAAIEGARRAMAAARARRPRADVGAGAAAAALGLLTLVAVLDAPRLDLVRVRSLRAGPRQVAARALVSRVPPAASVAADDPYVPHLSRRREVFTLPGGLPEYLLLDRRLSPNEIPRRLAEGRYEAIADQAGLVLLRRREPR